MASSTGVKPCSAVEGKCPRNTTNSTPTCGVHAQPLLARHAGSLQRHRQQRRHELQLKHARAAAAGAGARRRHLLLGPQQPAAMAVPVAAQQGMAESVQLVLGACAPAATSASASKAPPPPRARAHLTHCCGDRARRFMNLKYARSMQLTLSCSYSSPAHEAPASPSATAPPPAAAAAAGACLWLPLAEAANRGSAAASSYAASSCCTCCSSLLLMALLLAASAGSSSSVSSSGRWVGCEGVAWCRRL
jgi:hypothetical protein